MITRLGAYRTRGILRDERGDNAGQIGAMVGFTIAAAVAIFFSWGTATPGVIAGYAAFFGAIGATAGQLIGNAIDPVKAKEQQHVPASGIKDLYVTSAALGQMIPVLYGTFRMPGNIIQAGKKDERTIETPVPSQTPGSKGKGGGEDVQIIFSKAYSITMALGLCEGVILAVDRIWTDLDLFYDHSSDLGHLRYSHEDGNAIYFSGVNKSVTELIVYKGTEDQPRDSYLTALVPDGEQLVPAYRGLAYAVLADFDLGNSGRVPNFTFEVVRERGATERPIDLALIEGGKGVYVLYTRDMMPQPSYIQFAGLYVHMRTEPSNNDHGLLLEGPMSNFTWAAYGIGAGDIVVIEKALIEGNNGTARVNHVNGAYMSLARDTPFTDDHNQIDLSVTHTPLHTKDREGVLRSYQAPHLQEFTGNARQTGIFPLSIAPADRNGTTAGLVAVLVQGTQDFVADAWMDAIWIFTNGGNLSDVYGAPQPLRTPEEAATGTRLGLGAMASNGNRYFYICLQNINAVTLYDADFNTSPRAALPSRPQLVVWSPFEGGEGTLYVLREGDQVTRLSGGPDLSVRDHIPVGAGSVYGQMIRASDNRIWVSNNGAGSLSYFTTASDVGTVNVLPDPHALVQARDTFIWAASFDRGEISRVNPVTYAVQTFEVPDIMTSLAPAQGGNIWAISSQTRSAIYLIAPDGSYTMLTLPYGAEKVVADTSGEPSRDGYAYVMCSEANTVVAVMPDCSSVQTIDSGAGLARCVQDLCKRAGLSSDRVDVSGLLNTQVNFIVSEVASAKDTISLLGETYSFRFVETEGFVRFFYNHAVPTLATIGENVLAGGIDKEDNKSLGISRVQERELPTRVSVTYVSAERNYQDRAEVVQLTSGNIEQNPQVYRYPFAMTAQDAYQLAEIRLYEPWAQRERAQFTLPPLFMLLDPGDAVDVTARDIRYNIRLSEITRASTWLHTVRGQTTYPPIFLDPQAAAQSAAGRQVGRVVQGTQASLRAAGSTPQQISLYLDTIPTPGIGVPIRHPSTPGLVTSQPGMGLITLENPSRMAVILVEPPALSPVDIALRAYLGTYRTQPDRAFTPLALYRSQNGVIDFNYVAADSTESTAGRALTALPDVVNPFVWDMTNTVDIQMQVGTLHMVSQLDVLNGANRAMLGRWELIQFARATLIAPGVYRLSQLLRGRLGTESFTGTHVVGEGFVLLDSNTLRDTYLFERQIIDNPYFYRVVDATTGLSSAESFEQTMRGAALKPWAPVLRDPVYDDPAPGDVAFTWLYRSRLAPDLLDYSGIAWDVDFTKQFHVRIYTDATYSIVKNTYFMEVFIGSAEALLHYVYTVAQQEADFGSVQPTVYYGVLGIGSQSVLGYESRGVA